MTLRTKKKTLPSVICMYVGIAKICSDSYLTEYNEPFNQKNKPHYVNNFT